MESFNIYHDVFIQSNPSKVFDAISEAEHLVNWWPLKCSGNCGIGETYNFFFTKEYDWLAKIKDLKLNEYIEFEMTRSDSDWAATYFRFDLKIEGNGTMLEFSHCNWPENNHHYRRSSYCWAILLKGLKDYVEQGKIVPFEKRA